MITYTPPKNVLLLHSEKTPKTCWIGFPPNKCSKFLLLSLKSFVAEKKHVSMQKLFIKKNRQVSEILKTMGTVTLNFKDKIECTKLMCAQGSVTHIS